jgi:hypothetical protein
MADQHYAHGRKAWGICGRCGQRDYLNDLVFDGYYPSLRVHPRCYEARHPQDRLAPVTDPIALWRPSPEDYPITPPVLTGFVGEDANELVWSAHISEHVRLNRYRVLRAAGEDQPDLEDFTQIAALEIVYDDYGAIVTEPLEYEDEDVEAGTTYWYYVIVDDDVERNRPFSAGSNVISLTETFFRLLEDGSYRLFEDSAADRRLLEEAP